MTSDSHDRAIERDAGLVQAFRSAARNMRMELREWVQAELQASLVEAEMEAQIADGVLQDRIEQTIARLRKIDHNDLPKAVKDYDDLMEDVSGGGFTDVREAYLQLQQGCDALVRIMTELLEIRLFIGNLRDA